MRRDSVIHILALVATFLLVIIAFGFAGRAIVESMGNQAGRASGIIASAVVPSQQGSGHFGTVYVYGSRLVASKSDEVIRYHVQDMLSSNRLVVGDEGLLQSRFTAYPYGKPLVKESFAGALQKYTFTGKEADGHLQYFGARYMDARTGRFVSVDPLTSTFASYDYAENNPLVFVDPSGALSLRKNEYVVPEIALQVMYAITMDVDLDSSANVPGGVTINRNHMPGNILDFSFLSTSKKEKFFNLLEKNSDYSHDEIKSYYTILTTIGNIALTPDFDEQTLFHERIHEVLNSLSPEQMVSLIDARESFLSEPVVNGHVYAFTLFSIMSGNWQELYAYLGTFEEYPDTSIIGSKVYSLFEKKYSAEYGLYRDVLENARALDDGGDSVQELDP